MRTLTDVRRDLVQTIRQVVDIVSKCADGALPELARGLVKLASPCLLRHRVLGRQQEIGKGNP